MGHQLGPQDVTPKEPYFSTQNLGSLLGTEGTVTILQLQQSLDLSWEL